MDFLNILLFLNACAGYKPIFTSTNLQFEITNYSVEGNKTLGNKIYDKLKIFFRFIMKHKDLSEFLIDLSKILWIY